MTRLHMHISILGIIILLISIGIDIGFNMKLAAPIGIGGFATALYGKSLETDPTS